MPHSATPFSLALGQGGVLRVGDRRDHIDEEIEDEVKANKQRRKVQNRKNQRARRLRIRDQDPGSAQTSRPFQVMRWRIDEADDDSSQDSSLPSKGIVAMYALPFIITSAHQSSHFNVPEAVEDHSQSPWSIPRQYNVFRAFVSNKRTLNLLFTGWTDKPSSPSTCPISGPYRDDTSIYPLNPNIPPALFPTSLQQTRLHSLWINFFPFPNMRDNLIRREGSFDHWDLLQDLVGELMGFASPQERRGLPHAFTVSDPKDKRSRPLTAERDEDEVTAGRKGLIVWGEPHDMRNWEATPSFFENWPWVVDGCHDLVESSNRWRLIRGEEPMQLPGLKR